MPKFCRRLVALLTASSVLLTAGCGTYLATVALDDSERAELETLRGVLGDRSIVVVGPPDERRVAEALTRSGFNVRAAQDADAGDGPRVAFTGTSGGSLRDPWLTIFGSFVIPVWTDAYSYHLQVSDGRSEATCDCPVGVPMVYGWLAQPLRLLPRWKGWAIYMPFEDSDVADQRMALTIARRLVAVEPSR